MGLFSWCTSDTKKSISVDMNGYSEAPKKVYLLNPFGEAFEENFYGGYGVFAGQDVYALVAKWNAPEKCKDENGEWLPDDKIREIGIDLACYDEDHVQLKYPIKIVENVCSYVQAGISPSCPFQGYFYPDEYEENGAHEIKEEVENSFYSLYSAQEAYQDYVNCKGNEEELLKKLDFESYDKAAKAFRIIAAKHPETPERILMELAVQGNIYVAQELVNNPSLSLEVLQELKKKWGKEDYMNRRIRNHPNYKEEKSSLEDKIMQGSTKVSGTKSAETKEKKNERDM